MAERLATIPYVDSKFNPSTIMENLSSGFVLNTITGSHLGEIGDNFLKDGEVLDIDDYPNSKLPYDFTNYLDLDNNLSSYGGWFVYDSSVLFYDDNENYLRNGNDQANYVTGFTLPVKGMIDSSICSIENNGNAYTYYHTYNMKTGQKSTVTYTDHSFGEYSNRFIWFDYYSKCHYLHHSTVNDNIAKWVLKFSPSGIQKINYNPPSNWPMAINMFGNLWISNDDKKYSTNSGNTWSAIPSSLNIHHIVQGWSPNNIIVCEKNNTDNSLLELYRYTNFPKSKTKILSYDGFIGTSIESVEFGGFTQDGKMIIGLRFRESIGSGVSTSGSNGVILVSQNGEVSNLYRGGQINGYNNNAFKDHTIYSSHMQAKFHIIMSDYYSQISKLTKI